MPAPEVEKGKARVQPPASRAELVMAEVVVPPLPEGLIFSEEVMRGACPWLDAVTALSKHWSPRGYELFHEAMWLWAMSVVAGGRVRLGMGAGENTPLCIALIAISGSYAKTTTVRIATDLLKEAGFGWRLCSSTTTPQKLRYVMGGSVHKKYERMSESEQLLEKCKLAMSGQRGWCYNEFGGFLDEMNARSGPYGEFSEMLRTLYDCEDELSNDTFERDLITIRDPYLTMLVTLPPSDLVRYAGPGHKLWLNGFFGRFAMVAAPQTPGGLEPYPDGERIIPYDLIQPLQAWHESLGEPTVEIIPVMKGKTIVDHDFRRSALPYQKCILGSGVKAAYDRYNRALQEMQWSQITDLRSSYVRLPQMALRVAMLMASLSNGGVIEIRHWARAQHIAETWRASLHQLYAQMTNASGQTKACSTEEEIQALISRLTDKLGQPPKIRDMVRHCRRFDTGTLQDVLRHLELAGIVKCVDMGKGEKPRYMLIKDQEV